MRNQRSKWIQRLFSYVEEILLIHSIYYDILGPIEGKWKMISSFFLSDAGFMRLFKTMFTVP